MADVILAHGVEAVRKRIRAAMAPSREAVGRVSIEEGRRQVTAAVGRFFSRVDRVSADKSARDSKAAASPPVTGDMDWFDVVAPPLASAPVIFTHGIRMDVGVGKSHEARAKIVSTLVAMRKRGDMRNMALAVPTHALGDEQAAAFMARASDSAAGLRVRIFRGREAPDPSHPDYRNADIDRGDKTPMCGDLERVRDAQAIGLSAQTAVCKRRITRPDGTKETVTCPLFARCSYQRQSDLEADIWIISHDLLFHEKPALDFPHFRWRDRGCP